MTTPSLPADMEYDKAVAAEALQRLAGRLRAADDDEHIAGILDAVFGDEGLLVNLAGVASTTAETFLRRIDMNHQDRDALPAARLHDRYSEVFDSLLDVQLHARDGVAEVRSVAQRERAMGLPSSGPAGPAHQAGTASAAGATTPALTADASRDARGARVHFRRTDDGLVVAEYDDAAGPLVTPLLEQSGFVCDFTPEFHFAYHRLLHGMGEAYDAERLTRVGAALRAAGHRPTATPDIIGVVEGWLARPAAADARAAAARTTGEPAAVPAASPPAPMSATAPADRPRSR